MNSNNTNLDLVPFAGCSFNSSGEILETNNIWKDVFGTDQNSLLKVMDLSSRDLSAALNTPPNRLGYIEIKNKEINLRVKINQNDHSRYIGYASSVGTIFDEFQNIQLLKELVRQGEVASIIVHDINNPLSFLLTKSEILKRKISNGTLKQEDLPEFLDKVIGSANTISTVLSRYRGYAKDDSFDFAEMTPLPEFIEKLKTRIQSENAAIAHFIDWGNPPNEILRLRKWQCLFSFENILTNAAFAIREMPSPKITLSYESTDEALIIRIVDNGCGFKSDNLEPLFDPFRTDRPLAERTNLTLGFTRKALERNWAKIEVEKPRDPTTFKITFKKI